MSKYQNIEISKRRNIEISNRNRFIKIDTWPEADSAQTVASDTVRAMAGIPDTEK
jgi:hypothetical protein